MDVLAALPILIPKAIAWAEGQADAAAKIGQQPSISALNIARRVGVVRPERIRLVMVEALPMPEDEALRDVAIQEGLLGPDMKGLTLGHAVFVCHGHDTMRVLSHEFRHVFQYEQAGSIAAFLRVYLEQIAKFGYAAAPLEVDACAHEQVVSSTQC